MSRGLVLRKKKILQDVPISNLHNSALEDRLWYENGNLTTVNKFVYCSAGACM